MLVETASNINEIYVRLLDEGTDVIRPTRGIHLKENIYEILPTPEYDPNDERWEFPPGSIVRVGPERRSDGEYLVAQELVSLE